MTSTWSPKRNNPTKEAPARLKKAPHNQDKNAGAYEDTWHGQFYCGFISRSALKERFKSHTSVSALESSTLDMGSGVPGFAPSSCICQKGSQVVFFSAFLLLLLF